MARTSVWRSAGVLLLAAAAGCGSDITGSGRCPELCPSASIELADTLLTSPVASDTSVRGYVDVREAGYLLLANLDSLKSEALVRFDSLPTQWYLETSDTAVLGVVDSVRVLVTVLRRDTAAKALRIALHRLPAQFDTSASYVSIAPWLTDSTLWDTSTVGDIPDTLVLGNAVLTAPDTLFPLPGDSGIVSLGLSLVSGTPTALPIDTSSVVLEFFARGHLLQDSLQVDTISKVISVRSAFYTFVLSPEPGQPPSGVLAVGGMPAARAALRLELPPEVVDSNAIVRGTLILNTLKPVDGFARDSFVLAAQPLLRDNGPKSLTYPDSSVSGFTWLHPGQTGEVQVDITRLLRLWGTTTGDSLPRTVVLRAIPEGGLLSAASFAGLATGTGAPQLRVTYVRPYTFGVP